ncbi:type II toxin-antitoxin system RelE/ParE family toxin [Kovacikia minuta CCNUW1]|uniref:type II toxin-antitoxin system RelE/ParE family toxin n=1 Tax=Kovacikia minuta TaxID=2931930 RepID=UPI001CCE662A|nr:type II toxin-antitoxin system RelE/ParE family toxin [Kovacikia minuta]UBF28843.1 type II toxin-antitoxin system RelE/ParE family toxin [Kovacikia minuta CCNUW1]
MSTPRLPLNLTAQARKDFKQILNFTRKTWGIDQRDRYKALLDAALQAIASNPEVGKRRDEVRFGYYSYHVGSRGRHYIFYCLFEDRIEVVRILHDSMDLEQHLPH